MSVIRAVNHAARTEDIRWLARTGEGVEGAATRLGLTIAALEIYCRKHSLRDEWRALVLAGPRDWNASSNKGWVSV